MTLYLYIAIKRFIRAKTVAGNGVYFALQDLFTSWGKQAKIYRSIIRPFATCCMTPTDGYMTPTVAGKQNLGKDLRTVVNKKKC